MVCALMFSSRTGFGLDFAIIDRAMHNKLAKINQSIYFMKLSPDRIEPPMQSAMEFLQVKAFRWARPGLMPPNPVHRMQATNPIWAICQTDPRGATLERLDDCGVKQ